MDVAEDEGPGRWDDRWLPEGDARLDFGLDARAASFRDWLIVMAPVHAVAFLPPWYLSGLSAAIADLRAGCIYDDHRDNDSDHWDYANSRHDVRDRALRRLAYFGMLMPLSVFDAVWSLYTDFLAGVGREPHDLREAADRQSARDGAAAQWHLMEVCTWAYRQGDKVVSRGRYRCDPD